MNFDLATMIQQLSVLNEQTRGQTQQIVGQYQQLQTDAEKIAAAQERHGGRSAQISNIEQQMQIDTENASITAANAFGTNVLDMGNVIVGLGDQMRQLSAQVAQDTLKAAELRKDADLLDNPVGWAKHMLFGREVERRRDEGMAAFTTLKELANNLNASTQSTVQTQKAIQRTTNEDKMALLATQEQETANMLAAETRMRARQFAVNGLQELRTQGMQEFSNNMQMYNAVRQQEQWLAAFEERKAAAEERAAQKKERMSAEEWLADQTRLINAAAAHFNLPQTTPYNVRQSIQANNPIGEKMRWLLNYGHQLEDVQATGAASGLPIAPSPYEAVQTMQQLGVRLPEEATAATQLMKKVFEEPHIRELGAKPGVTPEMFGAAFNEELKTRFKLEADNMKSTSTLAIPDLSTMWNAEHIPEVMELKTSNFGREVLESFIVTGKTAPEAEEVLAATHAAVMEGKLTTAEAAKYGALYYQTGVNLVNATGGLQLISAPVLEGYKVRAERFEEEGPLMLSGPFTLTALAAREAGLTDMVTRRQVRQLGLPDETTLDLANPQEFSTALVITGGQAMRRLFRQQGAQ